MYTCGVKYLVEDSSKPDPLASHGAPSNQHQGEPVESGERGVAAGIERWPGIVFYWS